MTVRTKLVFVLLSLALAAAGCAGGSNDSPGGPDSGEPGDLTKLNTAVPACPFTAAKVSEIVGQPMTDDGNCLFGDGRGVASVTITVSSQLAGSSTYDYKRKQAAETYDKVSDIKKGDSAYVAVDDVKAEAVLISKGGSYTLIMSSFGFEPARYEQSLRAMLDEIPE